MEFTIKETELFIEMLLARIENQFDVLHKLMVFDDNLQKVYKDFRKIEELWIEWMWQYTTDEMDLIYIKHKLVLIYNTINKLA